MDFMDIAFKLDFIPNGKSAIRLAFSIAVGGGLGLFLRFLYLRCSSSVSNTNLISGVFPLLIMVTVCVIAVVKSSLALSLGLVGALSIVRFRTAIKDPEELVWLFMCIAVGVSLGASQLLFAIVLVFMISVFALGREFFSSKELKRQNLMVTISGKTEDYFISGNNMVMLALDELDESIVVQRYDVDQETGTLRFIVNRVKMIGVVTLVDHLKMKLPGCHISYINLDSIL